MREKVKAVVSGTTYKSEVLGKLEWVTKSKSSYDRDTSKDISVSLSKKKGSPEYTHVSFTFRNDIEKIFLGQVEYVQFCVYKNRIFFRPAESTVGYKLYKASSTCANKYTRFPKFSGAIEFVGDYELKYDDFLELYYIEKEVEDGD